MRVVSGGQTGADQAGWRAAKALGIPTGGWMPAGFLTEDGPRPDFAELYGATELTSTNYPARTRANARDSDATIWSGDPDSPGGRTTLDACRRLGRPVLEILDGLTRPSDVAAWVEAGEIREPNEGAREGMVEIAGQAQKKKIPAFLFVNNRLEGNAPSTIEAVANELAL